MATDIQETDMAKIGFNFNFDENEIFKVVKQNVDKLYEQHKGRPLAEVTKALEKAGVNSPEIAQAISDGVKPDVRVR